MILMTFSATGLMLLAGWIANRPSLLIMGFFLGLIGFALLLRRDSRRNHAVIFDIDDERSRRAHGYYRDVA